jgi:hypothetical protein
MVPVSMIIVEATDLAMAVRQVKLNSVRGVCPILMESMGEHLRLMTDSLDARVDVRVPTLDRGELKPTLIHYDTIARAMPKYPAGPVRITVDGPKLRLKGHRVSSGIFLGDPKLFPRRPHLRGDAREMAFEGVWPAICRVAAAADPTVVGWVRDLFLHDGYAYGTDKYRVHRTALAGPLAESIRLPGPVIDAAIKAKVEIDSMIWDGSHFTLRDKTGSARWTGGLGQAREVMTVAPVISRPFSAEPVCSFAVDRKEMIATLGRVLALKVDEGTWREGAWLLFGNDGVLTLAREGDAGDLQAELSYEATGTPPESLAFNAYNLSDTLQQLECETVNIFGSANPRAAWWTGDGTLEVAMMPTVVSTR